METKDKDFNEYAGRVFKERMKQLGLTKYRFHKDNKDITSMPTLMNVLAGKETRTKTLVDYCERLGLKMEIVQKDRTTNDDSLTVEQTAMLYESGFDTEGILHPTIGDLIRWLPKNLTFEDKTADFFLVYDSEFDKWTAGYQETDHIFDGKTPIEALFSLLMWKVRIYNEQMKSYNEDNGK